MPLDPQIKAMFDAAPGMAPARSMPVAQLRALVRQYSTAMPPLAVPLGEVTDRVIDGPGGLLPVRIYRPVGRGAFPLVTYFHGGGWVVGDLDTQDMICRALCHAAGCIVVSVDYRLAPEHQFPSAVDDAYAAVLWTAAHGAEFGGDPARLAVAGDSAGAVISAGVALKIREEGGPRLAAQVLFYGSMDHYGNGVWASMTEFAQGPILGVDDVHFFWDQYLGEAGRDRLHPYASPLRAAHHRDLPPAYVGSAELDPTRDPGEAYGAKLEQAGVPVSTHRYAGMPHGFVSWVGLVPMAQTAVDDAAAWLKRHFAAA